MKTIRGLYYEYESTRPLQVDVTVNTHFLTICFPEDNNKSPLKWDHNKIHTSDIPGSQKVSVNYGGYSNQSVEVDAVEFFEALKNLYPKPHYIKSASRYHISRGLYWLLGLAGFVIAFGALLYFIVLPLLVNFAIEAIPIKTEIEFGKKMAESALQGEIPDQKKTDEVNKFLSHIKLNSEYPIHITIVESEIKNAFAIPGGEIVIYTGLLNEMKDPSELIALLGHEIAHVEKRHTLKMLAKSMGLYLIVSVIFQDAGGMVALLAENASALERLSYNRSLENEADERGLEIVLKNNVDPRGMIALFNHLKRDSETDLTPEFLNTHPSLDERIVTLEKKLPKLKYTIEPNDSIIYYWKRIKAE